MSEDRRGKYKSAGKHASIVEDVKQRAQAIHKSKRRNVVSAKRKMGQDDEVTTSSNDIVSLEAVETLLKSTNVNDQCSGIIHLKNVLAAADPPIQTIINRQMLNTIAAHVADIHSTGRFNALCCLTNIANGDHAQTGMVLQFLSGVLQPTPDWKQVEQACWIVGNIAGDCYEYRTQLLNGGALQYVWHCIQQCMDNVQSSAATEEFASCAAVAAWALSNVARGATPASAFLEMGIAHGLCTYLQSATSWPTLRNEILWCLVFLLAKEEEAVDAIVRNDGIISNLVHVIQTSNLLESESGCIATIRCLGNLTSGPSQWMEALMIHGDIIVAFLHAMIEREIAEDSVAMNAVKKEAIWVLSNIIGGNFIYRQKILSHHVFNAVINCFLHSTFEVQREAVVAFHNSLLDADATHITQKLCDRNIVSQFVQLLSAHDQEIILMSISILRRIYGASSAAKSLFIECGVTDALDALHYGVADVIVKAEAGNLAQTIYVDMEEDDLPWLNQPVHQQEVGGMGRGAHLTKPAWSP